MAGQLTCHNYLFEIFIFRIIGCVYLRNMIENKIFRFLDISVIIIFSISINSFLVDIKDWFVEKISTITTKAAYITRITFIIVTIISNRRIRRRINDNECIL